MKVTRGRIRHGDGSGIRHGDGSAGMRHGDGSFVLFYQDKTRQKNRPRVSSQQNRPRVLSSPCLFSEPSSSTLFMLELINRRKKHDKKIQDR